MSESTMTRELSLADAAILQAQLEEDAGLQDDLARNVADLRGTLVAQKLDAMEAHLQRSRALLTRLEDGERKRRRIFDHLLRVTGLAETEAGIRDFVARAPSSARGPLEQAHARLRESAGRVVVGNRQNRLLAREAIELNHELLRAMLGASAGSTTYGADGSRETAAGAPVVDCRF